MKRHILILLSIIVFTACGPTYRLSYNKYIDGSWGEWDVESHPGYVAYGTPDDFVYYHSWTHPSQYVFKVKIYNFSTEKLKQGKGEGVDFFGTITYRRRTHWGAYTIGMYDYKKQSRYFVDSPIDADTNEFITRNAKIKAFYHRGGAITYNVFFDDVGFGLTVPWKK